MKKTILAFLFSAIVLVPVSSAVACHIQLDFDPNPVSVIEGDSFSIGLFADIPEKKSIVSWGLGLHITNGDLLSLDGITVGDAWTSTGVEPDLFGGIVGTNSPIFGDDVLLATFDFICLDVGTSYLDLFAVGRMMGFREAGEVIEFPGGRPPVAIPGDLVRFDYNQGVVVQTPIPEPSTLLLFGCGLIGVAGIRKKLKSK
jgi:hypothetical protein